MLKGVQLCLVVLFLLFIFDSINGQVTHLGGGKLNKPTDMKKFLEIREYTINKGTASAVSPKKPQPVPPQEEAVTEETIITKEGHHSIVDFLFEEGLIEEHLPENGGEEPLVEEHSIEIEEDPSDKKDSSKTQNSKYKSEFGSYCYDAQGWESEWARVGSYVVAKFRVGRIFSDTEIQHPRLRRQWQVEKGIVPEPTVRNANDTPMIAFTADQLKRMKWIPCYNSVSISVLSGKPVHALVVQADAQNATEILTADRLLSFPNIDHNTINLYRPEAHRDMSRVWWSVYPQEVECFVAISSALAKRMKLHVGDSISIKTMTNIEEVGYLQQSLFEQKDSVNIGDGSLLTAVPGIFNKQCVRLGPKSPSLIGQRIYHSIKLEVKFPVSLVVAHINPDTTNELGISQQTKDLLKSDFKEFVIDSVDPVGNYNKNDIIFNSEKKKHSQIDRPKYVPSRVIPDVEMAEYIIDDDFYASMSRCVISADIAERMKLSVGDYLILRSPYNLHRELEQQAQEQATEAKYERKFQDRLIVEEERKKEAAFKELTKGRDVKGWAEAYRKREKQSE